LAQTSRKDLDPLESSLPLLRSHRTPKEAKNLGAPLSSAAKDLERQKRTNAKKKVSRKGGEPQRKSQRERTTWEHRRLGG
jgi:hypothetical protein